MKKLLSMIGLTTIITISFVISEKTITAVKNVDELMTEIKEKEQQYEIIPIEAEETDDTIIPGLNGKKINIEKTYEEMKKIGSFNEKYIKYKEVEPKNTSKQKYDKYIISGNPKKNTVSIIFIVYNNDNIEKILETLEKNDVKATFFIDLNWLEKNNQLTLELIKKGHTIGSISANLDYEQVEFTWMNNIIKKLGKQKINYCYAKEKIEKNIKACSLQKNYTIIPNIIADNNPLKQIKKNIKSGSLIAMPVNTKTNEELDLIIKYIKTKNYKLDNLQNHLSEKNDN